MSLRGDSRGAGEATADEPERRQGRRNWVRFIPARERGGRLWYPFGAWPCSALPLTRARPRMSEAAGQPHVRFRRSIILMFPRLDNKSLSAGGWLMYSPSGHHECRRTHAWDGLRPWGDAAWVLSGRCARFEGCISCEPEYASAASGLARLVPFGYHECQPSLGTAAVMCVQLGSARDAAR